MVFSSMLTAAELEFPRLNSWSMVSIQSKLYMTTTFGTIQKWSSWTGSCLIKHLYKMTTTQIICRKGAVHRTNKERPFFVAKGFNTNLVHFLLQYHVIITCTDIYLKQFSMHKISCMQHYNFWRPVIVSSSSWINTICFIAVLQHTHFYIFPCCWFRGRNF